MFWGCVFSFPAQEWSWKKNLEVGGMIKIKKDVVFFWLIFCWLSTSTIHIKKVSTSIIVMYMIWKWLVPWSQSWIIATFFGGQVFHRWGWRLQCGRLPWSWQRLEHSEHKELGTNRSWDTKGWDNDTKGWDNDTKGWDNDTKGWDNDTKTLVLSFPFVCWEVQYHVTLLDWNHAESFLWVLVAVKRKVDSNQQGPLNLSVSNKIHP